MDFNEIPEGQISRHPWELSRTESILWELRKYLKRWDPGNPVSTSAREISSLTTRCWRPIRMSL